MWPWRLLRRRRPVRGRHLVGVPVAVAPEPAVLPVPVVRLGFRDGSSADLDPAGEQFLALERLARALTGGAP